MSAQRLGLRQSAAAIEIAAWREKRQRSAALQNLAEFSTQFSKSGRNFN
jgi:hypothetical protein